MAPLVKEFKNSSDFFTTKVCVTAQHREMLDQVLDFFDIEPDFDLDLMKPGQNLYSLTANIIESLKPVLTLAYDVEARRPKILSSYNYPSLSLVDACSATSAAPIYFPTYKTEADEWFIDGGVVTNNPALISYTEAKEYFNTDDIKILSIGTGINTRKIPGKKSSQWGGLGWLRHDIMGIMLETQIEHKIAKDLLKTKYLRINSPLGKVNRRLDDDSKVNLERICMLGNHWWDLFKNETIDFLDNN